MIAYEIIIVFALVLFLLLALYREWLRPSVSFFVVIVVLALTGILTPKDVLQGFANEQLAVIVLLLLLSEVIRKSSVINVLFDKLFRPAKTASGFIGRMMLYVAPASAFFNNTPLVAMMMPYIYNWSRKNNVAPSKLMIPLSYAAIIGGCVTLVGTSTNLIVNGMAVDEGYTELGIFDFAWVGLPMLIIGGIYMTWIGPKLLPDHADAVDDFNASSREYFVEVNVNAGSRLIGKSISDAGLRNLEGLFLIEIVRGDEVLTPVSPEEALRKGDKLIFTGVTESISELTKPGLGLSLPQESALYTTARARVVEVVVSHNSWLIGKRVQDSDFRARFDGGIIAIHRNGERLSGKIGDLALRAGDALLVLTGNDFLKLVNNSQDVFVIGQQQAQTEVNMTKVALLVLGLLTAVVLSSLGVISLFTGLLVLLGAVLLLNIVPLSEIRRGIDMDMIILLALGLALGKAMINSGAAGFAAQHIINLLAPLGPVALLAGIFVVTNLLASYITNAAAVAIIFPISYSIAQTMGLEIKPFILIVALGGAANFITPVGYQTNLMVYGPGGYSFKDFFRIGLPLTLLYLIVGVTMLSLAFGLI